MSAATIVRVALFGALAAGAIVGCSTVLDLDAYRTASGVDGSVADASDASSADAIAAQRSDWARWPLPVTFDTAADAAPSVASEPDSGVYTVSNLFTFYVPAGGARVTFAEARAMCQARGGDWELPTRVELVALWDPRATVPPYGPTALPTGPVWSQTLRRPDSKRYWVANFGEKGSQFLTTKHENAYAICIRRGA